MKYTLLILTILTCFIAGCSNSQTNNPNNSISGTYDHAVELYKAKKYNEVLISLESSVSLDNIHSKDINDEEALYLISYIKNNAFNSDYEEALSYTDYLRPIDNVLTDSEITEIESSYPQLQAAVESTIKGEEYNAKQQEIKDRSSKGVEIGMTKEEVTMSNWGKPKDINKTTTANGVSEQWVYSDSKFVYFKDGIVTAYQE